MACSLSRFLLLVILQNWLYNIYYLISATSNHVELILLFSFKSSESLSCPGHAVFKHWDSDPGRINTEPVTSVRNNYMALRVVQLSAVFSSLFWMFLL